MQKDHHHECPCINVLSIEISSCLNVETEPGTKWCDDGETEPTEARMWREPAHEHAEKSLLMNVETEPGIWKGVHS